MSFGGTYALGCAGSRCKIGPGFYLMSKNGKIFVIFA